MATLRLVQFDSATGRIIDDPRFASTPADSTDAILARLKTYFTHTVVETPAQTPSRWTILNTSVRDAFAVWGQRIAERNELARATHRNLIDMGMTRDQADAEVRKPFWRA